MEGPERRIMKTLFQDLRTSNNLFAAWRHVKRSALNSKNGDIRGKAAAFEHHHHSEIRRLQTELREGRFTFDDVEGVLKDKKKRLAQKKDPRPIAIGTIRNKVVQRAILQVLQPRKLINVNDVHSKFQPQYDLRLGSLNDVNTSRYGVGGLMKPYGGVKPAIESVLSAMSLGHKYFFRSDIKAFFTKIPTNTIVQKIREETKDDKLTELFAEGLEVHLANAEEIAGYTHLFPKNGIGVAQGSSLSAFAGNVLLFDFDQQLNNLGVSAIRYIDDVLITAPSETALHEAIRFAKQQLNEFGLSLYAPQKGSDKAEQGECANSFGF